MTEHKKCPAFLTDMMNQCRTQPERLAFIDKDGRESSYGDLLEIIERTSGYLKDRGVVPGSFIVINLPNCMEFVAVELGVWLSGCTVVPANPLYPKARLDFISRHCSSPLTVDGSVLEEIRQAPRLEACEALADIAALFYTSGSTGSPKAVVHTFSTLSHIDRFDEIVELHPDDRFGTGAPMSFIAWIFIIPFLRAGASVRLIDRETMTDLNKLQACYDNEGISVAFISPSALKQLTFKDNKTIRMVMTGSERVSHLKPESGSYRLVNIYGMTETAAAACFFEVKESYANTPIGKPLSDIELKIMDDGEICLRGLLTPGYFKDVENSAALWIDGWLHTGDLGRMLPDGNVEFLNRKDWMVKINGQRVETGEISNVIKEIPLVSNAIAKGFTAADGHQYIVAYYLADKSVSEEEIRKYLSGKLAAYMIPSYFVRMEALPVNANGKIDVKSLQSPVELRMNSERTIASPENEQQKVLCHGFELSLGISPIGIEDDFFRLGGDSIRVMQLQQACPELNLSSSMVYRGKTVKGICALLNAEASLPQEVQTPDICPLSQTQAGIFVECMNRRGEIAYNNPFLFKLDPRIDAQRLALACEKALKTHPNIFAAISVDADGIPHQQKRSSDDFHIEIERLSDKEFQTERHSLVKAFDILSDRLFRIRIFRTPSSLWLFMDFHHIIFDGSSNAILLDDMDRAYAGLDVETENFTGFDVAVLEQAQRRTDFLDECRRWNTDTFREPSQTSLPDPDRFSGNDVRVSFAALETETGISSETFAKTAEKLGVSENILATGAFAYMLGACTHASNSAFATIYNGRRSLKTTRTISMLVKTLPVYCKWNKETRLGDYFSALNEQILGSMAHDLYSFAEICRSTCYDSRVIFTYQDELLERKELCGLPCEKISLLKNATGEPLAVQLYKKDGKLAIRTEYRSNMFTEDYVAQMISCFNSVLSSLLTAERQTPASALRFVSEESADALLAMGKGETLDYDRNETFVSLFRQQVSKHGDDIALVDEESVMNYSELDMKSDILASLLVREGVRQEDFVALMLPRLNCFPLAFIAVFKSGAAYLPMDYEYPVERLKYMLEDSQARVLVTTHDIYDNKSKEGELKAKKIIFIDDLPGDVEVIKGIDKSAPDHLAYMIYTSGTTGKPKGVMIEHHSLVNLVHWYSRMENIGPGSRIAEHASFSFDASILDSMTPLCFGAQLHILSASIRKDAVMLNRYFRENKIDGVIFPTQLGMAMLRMFDLNLKYLMLGGEKLSGPVKTHSRLYNAYGPTEFTVCSSYYPVDPDNLPDNIPIGKAVPNTLSAIIDSCGRLLPRGIAGELVLVGEQLSRGYWHREDITAERFEACPFIPGQKMYHTGDLVKWSEDGELLFLGRIDTQVKLRGFRIELGEVESTMSRYDGVKSAVAVVKEIGGTQHLCGYYCSDDEIDNEKFRAFLAETLTEYMIPTALVRLDEMPMTPNGKIDMRNLPTPQIKAEAIEKPEGELEKKIFELVSEQLHNEDFGVTTNLISMGLTSLGAITLSLQLEKKASIKLSSAAILEKPTIRQMASAVNSLSKTDEPQLTRPVQDFYPMTDNQTGLYIDWEQHKESTQYNVPLLFKFSAVSPETLVKAVEAFVLNHPYIKTCFKSLDGRLVQVRNDQAVVHIPVIKLDSEPDEEFFRKQILPFSLLEAPLFRFKIFTYCSDLWLLSDIHHIIFDGGSEALFTKEILDFCNGSKVAAEAFSAFDYSLYYNEWKESDQYAKAEQYFVSLLENSTAASLPSATPEGKGAGNIALNISREGLRKCCRKAGVTENALFLTSVTQVLHRFTREDNVAILTVSNGRSLSALERTVGMFVQTLPVVSHNVARTVGQTMRLMHAQIIETLARDKFPYTRIVEKTGLKAGILVAYQGGVMGEDAMVASGKPVQMSSIRSDTAKFPLSINIVPSDTSVTLNFEYDKSVYGKEDVSLYAEAVLNFTENLVRNGLEAGIDEVSCVSLEEEAGLVSLGSGPELEVDKSATIVSLFTKNATAHPDDIAVCDKDSSFSYGELDRKSDALAHILVNSGVRNEAFVGIMLPRRKEFVLAYMAVYKSGAAYVPMDYEYPFDRLQYMLDDSMAKVLITTREIFQSKKSEGELKADCIIFMDELDLSESVTAMDNSTPDGLAYMIYTSGTTGKPKGVMVEHHALMNTMAWNRALEKLERGTRVASHASFSFDASVIDLMTCIAYGGEMHIMDEECRKDPEQINKFFIDRKIEAISMSTQMAMLLLNSYDLTLRYIAMGGEKLTGRYSNKLTIANSYGPTEFTVCSSYHIVNSEKDGDNIPIGKPVPNTVSAVVDSYGRLLPRGVPGELVLIGPQLARGYWNKEETTRKRFVPCPFVPGQNMYHTGDLVRWNENGELMFISRVDTQVKLRGFRIELGEIESVMASFPDVKAAVAQVKEVGGIQHLCGYFTASGKIDLQALKAHLSSSLTSYMVPDALMQLDIMPLTPNGKVDVKKLPLPELGAAHTDKFEAPQGELEKLIAEAFTQALGTSEPIGRNTSFFQMGGTSLLVMKVVVALSNKGCKVTYGDVFNYPAPSTLAAFLQGVEAGAGAKKEETVTKAESVAAIPVKDDEGYDYTQINKILSSNVIELIGNIGGLDANPIGDVLLLGSTGYLGIHVLQNLLENTDSKVFCIVRPRKGISCAGRLKSYLMYYFDNTYGDLFDKRLFVMEGDMSDDSVRDKLGAINVDTVINCAANVKHFAAGDEIEKINLHGAERLIDFCLETGARLIHTSTHSISGQMEDACAHLMLESELYFGQSLMTKYQTSKFLAERAILEACGRGLKAKIMRLGNLMPRFSDGEFQINLENNGFMSRMRAYYMTGCIASSHLHSAIEFAPIDATASAILTLARTPDKFTVFHPFNNHTVFIDDMVAAMRQCGLGIRITDDAEFSRRLNECLEDDRLNPLVAPLLAYGSHNNYVVNNPSLDFTVNVLNAMDWRWPITGNRYFTSAIEKMKSLEFFDK